MDPFWNVYLLASVLSISDDIEKHRIAAEQNIVFSYRAKTPLNDSRIFRDDIGWNEFIETSKERAKNAKYVLMCDIADCYQRIYHHRLENALKQLKTSNACIPHILEIVSNFSQPRSYGVPIGGPAARLLVELVLDMTDKLLHSNNIVFCRFADDYHIFCNSLEDAYRNLLFLSEKLQRTEGLSLQKSKTRIISSEEFLSSPLAFPADHPIAEADDAEADDDGNPPTQITDPAQLLRIALRYDPYSPTAEEDYEELKAELKKFDILGMLNQELAKTRAHGAVTRKIVQAIKYLENPTKSNAILTLIQNLDALYPLYPTVAIAIRDTFDEVNSETQNDIMMTLRERLISDSHVLGTDLHQAFAVRVLSKKNSTENSHTLISLHKESNSPLVRRDVILILARWGAFFWLSDIMNDFQTMSPWERRAFIVASYFMGDQGSHWRTNTKSKFTPLEVLVRDWAAKRLSENPEWSPPI